MEELSAIATKMPADDDEWLEEWDGAEVVDLHVSRHGEDVKRTIELAHCFVEECGYETSVQIAGRAFVVAVELNLRGCGGMLRVICARSEDEMKPLWVGGAAAEAMAGAFVEGGVPGHGIGCMAGFIGRGHVHLVRDRSIAC
jgi:hypothetical protein